MTAIQMYDFTSDTMACHGGDEALHQSVPVRHRLSAVLKPTLTLWAP